MVDALGQERDLDAAVPGVGVVGTELRDQLARPLGGEGAHAGTQTSNACHGVSSPTYIPRLFDVMAHLLDERVDRGEAPLAAQPFDELDPQTAAVDVPRPVDQEGLDQLAAARLELRSHADVDGGRDRFAATGDQRPRGVDAVARAD